MEVTASSPLEAEGLVRLEPRSFRWSADGVSAVVFVAVIGFCIASAAAWGHAAAVLGAVYATMALVVWLEALRSTWAIGPDVLVARRFARWRTIRAEDVTSVAIEPGEPGVDLSVAAGRSSRVVIALDDWRQRPAALDRLGEFLANAQRRGARVDPRVWDTLH